MCRHTRDRPKVRAAHARHRGRRRMRLPIVGPEVAAPVQPVPRDRHRRLGNGRRGHHGQCQTVVARGRAGERRARERHGLALTNIRISEGCCTAEQAHVVTPDHSRECAGLHGRCRGTVVGFARSCKAGHEALLAHSLSKISRSAAIVLGMFS